MMKTKVAFITPSLGGGGLERAAINFANIGVNEKKIFIFSFSNVKPFYLIDRRVRVFLAPYNSSKNKFLNMLIFFKKIIWLRKSVRSIQPNIVCCFGERYNPFFICSVLGLSQKIVVLNRASPLSYISGWRKLIGSLTYKLADLVIFQTQIARRLVEKKYGIHKTFVLGNPIDLSYSKMPRENVILNVGSFSSGKNQIALIEMFYLLLNEGMLDWQLHFVGTGKNLVKCQKRVKELEICSFIKFHGQVKDIKTLLAGSEIFAFVSRSEGFPNALAEALAYGCASIAYDCMAGPSELIDDGENGFLIPLDNEQVYSQKLLELIKNEKLRKEFSSKSIIKMQKFDAGKIAERFYKVISS